jgi:hypothetical protein
MGGSQRLRGSSGVVFSVLSAPWLSLEGAMQTRSLTQAVLLGAAAMHVFLIFAAPPIDGGLPAP